MNIKFKPIVFIVAVTFILAACSTVKPGWTPDYETLAKDIKKSKKDGLILFTVSDNDERSLNILNNIFTEKTLSALDKKFLLHNVNIVKDESAISSKQLEKNYILFSEYDVLEVPHLALMTSDGDVYHSELIPEEVSTPEAFFEYLNSIKPKADLVMELKGKIGKAEGTEKIKAINAFFEKVYRVNSLKYENLFDEGIQSDPKNETGFVGSFILAKKYLIIDKLLAQKKYEEAINEFMSAIETKMLNPEEEQGAWHNIAYISTYFEGGVKKDKILQYLQKALQAAPSSNRAKDIKADIENLKNMK